MTSWPSAWSISASVSGPIRAVCSIGGMNSAGASYAMFGVMPAHQGLDAGDAPALKVDLWLVLKDELTALQCAADLGEQLQSCRVEVVALRRVHLDPAVMGPRVRERRVGTLQQHAGYVRVLAHDRDADARLDAHLDVVEHDRGLKARLDRGRRAQRVRDALGAALEHRVPVAGQARHERVLAHGAAETASDLAENEVPVGGAERVVDLREAVEVDQQYRDGVLATVLLRLTASSIPSMNSVRFGSPVSWS